MVIVVYLPLIDNHLSILLFYFSFCTQTTASFVFMQVWEKGSDSITVHALGVLTAIMSNSPSAKVTIVSLW